MIDRPNSSRGLPLPKLGRARVEGLPSEVRPQWVIGLELSSQGGQLSAALVAVAGGGLSARFEIAAHASIEVPSEAARLFRQLQIDAATAPSGPASLAAALVPLQSKLIGQLFDGDVRGTPDEVLAVGVHDPGLWYFAEQGPTCYVGLCDAARLAEATGFNVIDAFPARDVAQGGRGGPLSALPQWTLLRDPVRTRVLIDLGRTTRLTYLPSLARMVNAGPGQVLSFDVGPGTRLLDRLVHQLTSGDEHFDAGGRHAVQGRHIAPLYEHWLKDPYFQCPLPRWHPMGVRPERFLADAGRMAIDNGWSIRDILCTATHLIAETVARAVRQLLPEQPPVDEILLTGGGKHNGLLLREIGARLPEVPLTRVSHELGRSYETLPAACVAVLAWLHLAGIAANAPSITGASRPHVLGRLTPGSGPNWRRLLDEMAASEPRAWRTAI